MEDQDKIEHIPKSSSEQHKTDAKSDNVVDDAGQSFKLGGNEGASEESLEKAESSYTDKLQEDDRHHTDVEVDEGIRKERVKESKEDLHNTDEDLSKAITLYVPPSPAAYPTGNTDSQCYISDNVIAAISQQDLISLRHPVMSDVQLDAFVVDLAYLYVSCEAVIAISFFIVINTPSPVYALYESPVLTHLSFILQHIDVVFYNLRKKAKLDTTSDYRYTTVNCHRGHADEIKERAEILSTYLTISNFFEKKERTDWSLLDAYNEKMDQHAFGVHIVNGIVQQSSGTFSDYEELVWLTVSDSPEAEY
ncbi:hypothetical protein FXO38_11729 [Capsicum annuum]|nr:hypothetical protein FXO38_11729 [Capsicum annuum]